MLDEQAIYSSAQADIRTVAGGPYLSTNWYDHLAAGTMQPANVAVPRDFAKGVAPQLLIQVVTTFVGATATLTVELLNDDNAAMTSPVVIWTSGAIGVASLVAGYQFAFKYPPHGITQQFTRLRFTPATADFTAGAITAGWVDELFSNRINA